MASPAPGGIEMPLGVGQMMPAPAMFDATQPHILGLRSVGCAHPNSRSAASTLLVTEMFADGNPDEQPLWPRVDRESLNTLTPRPFPPSVFP